MLQGNVDLSFRVKGHKGQRSNDVHTPHPTRLTRFFFSGAGTLYYTSIRKAKGEPFTDSACPTLRPVRASADLHAPVLLDYQFASKLSPTTVLFCN